MLLPRFALQNGGEEGRLAAILARLNQSATAPQLSGTSPVQPRTPEDSPLWDKARALSEQKGGPLTQAELNGLGISVGPVSTEKFADIAIPSTAAPTTLAQAISAPTQQASGYDPSDPIFSKMEGAPGNPGSGMAINPRTGKLEQVYATYTSGDPDTAGPQTEGRRYFESDPERPSSAQSLAGYAPGFYSAKDWNTFDEFMSRSIPIAGLTMLGAGGAGYLGAGAVAGEGGLGAAGAASAAATEASQEATLQAILDSSNVPTISQGVQVAGPTEAAAGSIAPAMPAAVPPADPTFGGALTQTGAGQFENLVGQFGTTGAAAVGGVAGGAGGVTLADALKTAGSYGATAEAVNAATGNEPAPAPAPTNFNDTTPGMGTVPDPNSTDITGTTKIDPVTGLPLTPTLPTTTKSPTSSIGGTKLSDILSGNVGVDDLAKTLTVGDLSRILGTGLATAGSIYADTQRADAQKEMYNTYLGLGAPSRARYEASFEPGFDVNSIPGFTNALDTSANSVLRKLSTSGNPFGNPGQLTEAMNYISGNLALPALSAYRNQNAATGGFGAFSTAAPGVGAAAIDSGSAAYSDLARGASDIFSPPTDLARLLRQYQSGATSRGLT